MEIKPLVFQWLKNQSAFLVLCTVIMAGTYKHPCTQVHAITHKHTPNTAKHLHASTCSLITFL